jgi:hypothetical protein
MVRCLGLSNIGSVALCQKISDIFKKPFLNQLFYPFQLNWQIPDENELKSAQELIDEFLGEELDTLLNFANGTLQLTREQLKNRLTVVSTMIIGAGNALPHWDEQGPKPFLTESVTNLDPLNFVIHPKVYILV